VLTILIAVQTKILKIDQSGILLQKGRFYGLTLSDCNGGGHDIINSYFEEKI